MNYIATKNYFGCICSVHVKYDHADKKGYLCQNCYAFDSSKNDFISSIVRDKTSIIALNIKHVQIVNSECGEWLLFKCRNENSDAFSLLCSEIGFSENAVLNIFTLSSAVLDFSFGSGSCLYILTEEALEVHDLSKQIIQQKVKVNASHRILSHAECSKCIVLILQRLNPADLFLVQLNKDSAEPHIQPSISNFLSPLYSSILRCGYLELHCRNHDQSDNSVYICTSKKQLVHFRSGRIVSCTSLPFDDAEKIIEFVSPSFQKYLLIHSRNSQVSCIEEGTYKVSEKYFIC